MSETAVEIMALSQVIEFILRQNLMPAKLYCDNSLPVTFSKKYGIPKH